MLTVSNSTLSSNSALSEGGGILTDNTLTIGNSTLSSNSASRGGGILNTGNGTLTVSSCTLSNNSADAGGGLDNTSGGTGNLRNTIIAGNTAADFDPDVFGPITSQGHNLIGIGDGGSGFTATDLVGTSASPIDPMFGPLQNNGGPTQTMALLPGSPALDAGDTSDAPATDQRGFPRIVGGTIDIGAFEVQASGQATHLALQAPASTPAGTPFALTVTVMDDLGQPTPGYTGTVHFTASDGATANYNFTAADMGTHTFTGLVLRRAGTYTVTAADTAATLVTGSGTFVITAAAADHLAFTGPATVTASVPFTITVTVQDLYGNTVTGYTGTVHFAASTGGGTIATRDYTFTAADQGQHTFAGLVLNQPGDYAVTGDDSGAGIGGSASFTVQPG
jgi:hypothetical protein